jgi:hypothetical protein
MRWYELFIPVCSNPHIMKSIIAWPVAKLLEFVLGAHHGIIYRRAGESDGILCS